MNLYPNDKDALMSKTVIGAIAQFVVAMAALFGYTLHVNVLYPAIASGLFMALTIYGRIKAQKGISSCAGLTTVRSAQDRANQATTVSDPSLVPPKEITK